MTHKLYMLQAASAGPIGSAAPTSEDRSTTFRPVEGGNQMQSGERLLVEAYAAIWIILFAVILFSWRRQARLDKRIRSLEDAIEKARDPKVNGDAEGA